MFPKIRQVNGRAIIVGSPAAGLRAALVTGAERLVGTLKSCSLIIGTWRAKQEKKGRPMRLCRLPQLPHLRLGPRRRHLLARCLPMSSDTAPWAASKPITEVDRVHDNDQTAILRAAFALFKNISLPPVAIVIMQVKFVSSKPMRIPVLGNRAFGYLIYV